MQVPWSFEKMKCILTLFFYLSWFLENDDYLKEGNKGV